MRELEGKTCIITGGGGSLGLAAARLFYDQGANLALVDLDADRLAERAAEALGNDPDRILLMAADVGDELATEDYIARTVAKFGTLDVLFSNAGNFGTVEPIESFPTATFDSVLQVHVRGAFLAAKYAVPRMTRGGSIIITSSVAATRGDPGVYGYITAKHAQTGLMRCLAKELAPRGIRVNTLNPGPLANGFQKAVEDKLGEEIGRDGTEFFDEIIPMGRHGTAEEAARAALFLATDQSAFTTGTTLMVDGGMSA